MAKSKYEVLSNVEHDGKPFKRGDSILLEEEQAAPLIAVGALVADKRPEPKAEADGKAKK